MGNVVWICRNVWLPAGRLHSPSSLNPQVQLRKPLSPWSSLCHHCRHTGETDRLHQSSSEQYLEDMNRWDDYRESHCVHVLLRFTGPDLLTQSYDRPTCGCQASYLLKNMCSPLWGCCEVSSYLVTATALTDTRPAGSRTGSLYFLLLPAGPRCAAAGLDPSRL